jgi:hypothetical protein
MRTANVINVLAVIGIFAMGGCGPTEGATGKQGQGGVGGNACTSPPKDSDGDGISDDFEGAALNPPTDTDGDGIPDFKDPDSDNDGIPDSIEGRNPTLCDAPVDSDGDGKFDFRDLDSDDAKDGTLADAIEAGADPKHPTDSNGDGKPDYMDPDDDGDGVYDIVELTPTGKMVAAMIVKDAPDTDGDGTPDYLDTDSDGDSITDGQDGSADTDGDGIANFRDLDSDGDCISDAIEAGDKDPMTLPVDTDGDGIADFEDLDADNDGLADGKEDANCNGAVDACETSRILADTDGDGVSDLIEVEDCAVKPMSQQAACSCDASDPNTSPLTLGDFVFTVDYNAAPSPASETLDLSTNIQQADVLFVFDTTGSQSSSIKAVEMGLSGIVGSVQAKVPNIAFGVSEFRDFTTDDPFVFKYDYRITTMSSPMSPTLTGVQAAMTAVATVGDGGDSPEAGWEALYAIAGGPPMTATSSIGGSYTSTINLTSIQPTTPPAGETQGNVAGAGFRAGSVPIIVTVSDAAWHDAPGESPTETDPTTGMVDPHAGFDDYTQVTGVPSREKTIDLLRKLGAKVIGIAATNNSSATGDSTTRSTDTAYDTGAVVTPGDFGTVRPANCNPNQCCTGVSGVGVPPDTSGNCPLAFQYDDGNGNGIGAAVGNGIVALANGLKFDIHVQAIDVDPNTVENFMLEVVPNVSGMGPAAMCVVIPTLMLQDNFTGPLATPGSDKIPDTVPGIVNGQKVCFDVVPKMNTTVANTAQPQFFHAQLQVKGTSGGGSVNLGTPRDVFFLVPPKISNGPIQ